ncbi:hypothetical protein [Oceaniglobus trochenteri]|nr:hypothetical protein [Oceaniglobus trochenteri]
MEHIINKTDERYLVQDFFLFLVPTANLNRAAKQAAAPYKA